MSMRRIGALLSACMMIGVTSEVAAAQSKVSRGWIVADAAGYGALGLAVGFGAGIMTNDTCPFGSCTSIVIGGLTGALVGTMGGAKIAVSARDAVARGEPLGSGHRSAVTLGAVLGGATLGALGSSLMINGNGSGTPIGSDERTFALLTVTGLFGGAYFVARHSHELDPPRMNVMPVVGKGRVGLSTRMVF